MPNAEVKMCNTTPSVATVSKRQIKQLYNLPEKTFAASGPMNRDVPRRRVPYEVPLAKSRGVCG